MGTDTGVVGIDFFCGAGGLTHGLLKAGINVLKGIDIDSTVKDTYLKNNHGATFLNKDIRQLSSHEVIEGINIGQKKLLLAGCAPCQPFSSQNRSEKRGTDQRRSLIMEFARFIKELEPEYILVENVPGFSKDKNYKSFMEILKKLEYKFDEGVLNAADYGVPQKRLRYVILASKTHHIRLPDAEYGQNRIKYRTVGDIIRKFPKLEAGETSSRVQNHIARKLSSINLKRIKSIPKNGGSRDSLPDSLKLDCHTKHNGHSDVYGRMSWDKPAPTLTCRCTCLTNGRFGHPEQDRAISPREAAALQTFPDNYIFYGNVTDTTKHIGNSVPVLFAERLGSRIIETEHGR